MEDYYGEKSEWEAIKNLSANASAFIACFFQCEYVEQCPCFFLNTRGLNYLSFLPLKAGENGIHYNGRLPLWLLT